MFRQRKISLLFDRVLSPVRRRFSSETDSDCSSISDEEIQFEKKISFDGIISKSLSEPLLSDNEIYSSLEYEEDDDDETSSESDNDYSVYDEYTDDESGCVLVNESEAFQFSADPAIRSVEATELADDLLEEAFELVEEHMDIIEDFHLENLESLEERLHRTKEMMAPNAEDLPATRLLKARIYLNEAESFLTRVYLLIEMSIALEEELHSDHHSQSSIGSHDMYPDAIDSDDIDPDSEDDMDSDDLH